MTAVQLTISQAIIASLCIALVIFAERAFPFVLFSKKNPPAIIRFIEKYIPPMVMAALLFYCLKEVSFTTGIQDFIPEIAGVSFTVILHLWKRNSLLSIFGSTILYMILIRVM